MARRLTAVPTERFYRQRFIVRLAERAHFGQHKTAKAMYDPVVARYSSPATAALGRLILPYLFPELSAFARVEDLITHLRTSDTRYRAALPAEFLDRNPPPMYITLYFIVTRLPNSLRAVRDHFLALDPTDLTVDLLEKHLLAAKTSVVAVGAARGISCTPFFEGGSPSPLAPSYAFAAAVDLLGAEDVGAASTLSGKRRSSKGKVARVVAVAAGVVVVEAVEVAEVVAAVGVVVRVGALVAAVVAAVGVGGGGGGVSRSGGGVIVRPGPAVEAATGAVAEPAAAAAAAVATTTAAATDVAATAGAVAMAVAATAAAAAMAAATATAVAATAAATATTSKWHATMGYFGTTGGGSGGGRGGGVQWGGSGGGQRQQQQERRSETPSPQQLCEWFVQRGASGGNVQCTYVIRIGDRAGQICGKFHTQHRCFSRLDDAWRAEFGDEVERPRWLELLRSGVDIFALDYDAILAAMYALSVSAEGDCYQCVPPDPGIEVAALGASESALPSTTPAEALHTFILDLGASEFFFRDSTTLTLLPAPVRVRLADPSGGPVLARSSTVLPCPAVAASAQATASGPVAAHYSCRLLSHPTLFWHHHLGHLSLPRLRGMHSRLLVSGLPRSLPPLPPCLPCVEGQQRTAPHSSSFPPTTAPLQALHKDMWGPARVSGQGHERYFLLVVDDYTRYTTVFPLRSKGEVSDVLIPWIRAVRLQRRKDLPVLRLHSDRGGEFSSDLLRDFCRGEGIL
ncbi:unnamed protein product [Closterium sp. NIES-54]